MLLKIKVLNLCEILFTSYPQLLITFVFKIYDNINKAFDGIFLKIFVKNRLFNRIFRNRDFFSFEVHGR